MRVPPRSQPGRRTPDPERRDPEKHGQTPCRRGDRVAEGAALEMPCTACPYRGFESRPLRSEVRSARWHAAGSATATFITGAGFEPAATAGCRRHAGATTSRARMAGRRRRKTNPAISEPSEAMTRLWRAEIALGAASL